jgi:glycosyltransferase involved in cell wall biosynthesis
MTRHLAERGWAVDVVARDFTDVPGIDRARLLRLPPGTRVFSVADREPLVGRLQHIVWSFVRRLIRGRTRNVSASPALGILQRGGIPAFVRAYLAWLDFSRQYNWARGAEGVATALARTERYTVVISSGPPHMAHIAGWSAARSAGLPFVADMRDPWSLIERLSDEFSSPVWFQLARRYETRVVRDAMLVTMNTEAAAQAMRSIYPASADRIEAIRNGSDDEAVPTVRPDNAFRIRFAGSIYLDRDPRLFFRAIARLIRDLGITPRQLIIEFVGEVDRYGGIPTYEIAKQEGIAEYVSIGGLLSRQQVFEFLAGATMLLSLPQDSDFAIPAKIYEYVKMPAWMLVLAHHQSATAQVLKDTEASVVDPADVEGMVDAIRRRFEEFQHGATPSPVGRDGRFDRSHQSEKLVRLLAEHIFRWRASVPTPP